MSRKRLAIIGNGMATGRLLDELLRREGLNSYEITVFGEEPHGCYNRILLSRVLTGGSPDDIMLKPRSWYAEQGVRFHAGLMVTRLDAPGRKLSTADGQTFPYDVAVFAAGSAPFVPKMDGLQREGGGYKDGVFLFRTIEDCRRMREYVQPASSAVVVGGGLLGLEAAKALCDMGLHVTVLHLMDTLMNTQVDRLGGQLLRKAFEQMGIFVRTGQVASAVLGDERVEAVKLDNGETLPADLVVISAGIRPRIEVAKASGIPTKNGILVNDVLATQVPGVYAVGECAEHQGKVYGIVQPIWEQCAVLADVLTAANPKARYRGSKLYTRLKVAGVEVASMGLVEPEFAGDEVVQVIEERKGVYRKLIVREGKLVGAVLIGDADAAATLVQLFDRGEPLPTHRLDVLCSAEASPITADPEICNCNHVNESTILDAIRTGQDTLSKLADCTRAGTGCGSCRGQLASLILKNAAPGSNGVSSAAMASH
jgi:nitrite reductase (NADH) large subunit